MPDTPRAALQRPVHFDVEVECAQCHRLVPLAAPILRSSCGGCGTALELGSPAWLRLFQEADQSDFSMPEGDTTTHSAEQPTQNGRLVARWMRSLPRCTQCQNEMMLIEPGIDSPIECGACGTKNACAPAPAWLRSELPTAMQLYCIPRGSEDSAVHASRGFWLTFQGTPPALSQQHRQAIEAAIGPPPVSGPVVPTAAPRRRWGWEWYAIAACGVLIVVAVHQCGSRLGRTEKPAEGTEVEPSL